MQRGFPTRWGSDHEISSTACHKHCNNSPPHQLSNFSHFSARDMPHERDADGRDFRPPFPFVNITGGSPHTPTCKSGLSLLYDARQMQPIDNPFYPSPFSGLCFNKSGRVLAREGALIAEPSLVGTTPVVATPNIADLSGTESVVIYYEGWSILNTRGYRLY